MTSATEPQVTRQVEVPGPDQMRRAHWWLAVLLLAYTAVTVGYGIINPLFEAPDEHWHYFTTQTIADNRRLPFVAPGDTYDEWLSQEAAQPPLAYILGSLLVANVDTASAREDVWLNKFADIGDASALININRFIHTGVETWPWQGYALAAHLLRLLSTVLGLGTLLFIYGSGRLLWPRDPLGALLAVGLVAFMPQYNFLHAAISNDPLIILLVSAALWQIVRLWQTGLSNGRVLFLGLTVGLAALTKNAGITAAALRGGCAGFAGLARLACRGGAARPWWLAADRPCAAPAAGSGAAARRRLVAAQLGVVW